MAGLGVHQRGVVTPPQWGTPPRMCWPKGTGGQPYDVRRGNGVLCGSSPRPSPSSQRQAWGCHDDGVPTQVCGVRQTAWVSENPGGRPTPGPAFFGLFWLCFLASFAGLPSRIFRRARALFRVFFFFCSQESALNATKGGGRGWPRPWHSVQPRPSRCLARQGKRPLWAPRPLAL